MSHSISDEAGGLKVLIIGAGIGGLSTALSIRSSTDLHRVTVLEASPSLAEIGAGFQLTPNSTRLLERWQLSEYLSPAASVPELLAIHRYSDGKVLDGRDGYGKDMQAKFHAPYWNLHRIDVQQAMFQRATALGVEFRFASKVEDYDFEKPAVVLEDGEVIEADLLIAADGLWSRCRSCYYNHEVPPHPTGDMAYRIVFKTDQILDSSLKDFIRRPEFHIWVGPRSHVVFYSLRNHTMLNLVLLVPDSLPESVSKTPGDLEEMKALFRGWDPRLNKFLELVEKVDKWRLMHLPEMSSWTNASTKSTVAFLGDACHPMLPYMAQGANSAIEDGAVLGVLLSKITNLGPQRVRLSSVLKLFEKVRKSRSEQIAAASRRQRYFNHLPDGPEQEARDKLMSEHFENPQLGYPFFWFVPEMQDWVFGYDAILEAEKAWGSLEDRKEM